MTRIERIGLALLAALVVYNGATLARVPAFPHDDDGAYASAAYQVWRTGEPGIPGYRDVAGYERHCWSFGRIAAVVQGVFLHLFGVSIFAALLPSFLAGLGVLGLTAALGRALWGGETGGLAALLLAASGKFFEASRWARPDMLLTLCFLLALWLVATARSASPYRRVALAGLVMGLAGDVHLNGFLLVPVPFIFWLLLRPESRGARWRAAAWYAGAVAVGVLWWIGTHYWPHPEEFRAQWALDIGGVRAARLGLIGALKAEIGRYIDWFWEARGHRHFFEGVCVLAGGAWVAVRGGRAGRAMVSAWVSIFLIAAAFILNPYGWYLIFVWPLFALWMAQAGVTLPRRLVALAVLAALMAAYFVNLGLWGYKAAKDVPLAARVPELRGLVPADAPVLANGALWFAFWDRDFTDEYYLKLRELTGAGPTGWEAEQRRLGWRYVVAYGDLRRFMDPEIPLEAVLASGAFQGREAEARAARDFSLAHCVVERRIQGFSDTILVLRVSDEPGSR